MSEPSTWKALDDLARANTHARRAVNAAESRDPGPLNDLARRMVTSYLFKIRQACDRLAEIVDNDGAAQT